MQKRRFDLRQLREQQLARWRAQRARITNVRSLDPNGLQARAGRLKGEHIVVVIALLFLIGVIVVQSRFSHAPGTSPGTTVALNGTATTVPTATGTLVASSGVPGVIVGTPTLFDTTTALTNPNGTAYPAPEGGRPGGPVGVGTPQIGIPTPPFSQTQGLPTFQPIPGQGSTNSNIPGSSGNQPGAPSSSSGGFPGLTGGQQQSSSSSNGQNPYPGPNAPPPGLPSPGSGSSSSNNGDTSNSGLSGSGSSSGSSNQPPFAFPTPRPPVTYPTSPPALPTTPRQQFTPIPVPPSNGGGSSYPAPGATPETRFPTPVPTVRSEPSSFPPPVVSPTSRQQFTPIPAPTNGSNNGGSTTGPGATQPSRATPIPTTAETPIPTTPAATATPSPTVPSPTATPIPPTATPTPVPYDMLGGQIHWTAADSPVVLKRDTLLVAGASLQIDPGVEVQIAKNAQLAVEGTLAAQGTANAPVRFTGPTGRWTAINGQPGSNITLRHVALRQAGLTGVALASQGGTLVVQDSTLEDSGGGITTNGANVDIERTIVTGNDLPYGPAVSIGLGPNHSTTLVGSIIGGNQVGRGTPQVQMQAGTNGAGPIDIEGNLVTATNGPGFGLATDAPLGGTIRCNNFPGGTVGLTINATTPSGRNFALAIDSNAFTGQTSYGAASTVALDMTKNWWGDTSGPYDAKRNPQGKGVHVGVNLLFQPWLTGFPGCAPTK